VKANALTTGGDTSGTSKDADEILKRYFDLSFQSTHITIDDEGMDARANQMELDTSPMEISKTDLPFYLPIDKEKPLSSVANALSAKMPIEDDGKVVRQQMDSGCCGMSMLGNPAYFPYGLAHGNKINVHTAEKGTVRQAKACGVAAGSVATIKDLQTRAPGPRRAIRTGLAVCDDAIHGLVNENRFDINLDGTSTPHRVDKKNRCIWMYEGTDEQFLVPLDYERDALYID
jgi:hypothetical protein